MSKTITVSDETWAKIKDQVTVPQPLSDNEWAGMQSLTDLVGKAFFFRTVTYHIIGRVVGTMQGESLILEDATWVADSGRFMQAIKDGKLSETEPVGRCILRWDAVTDAFPWIHSLDIPQQ